MLIQRTPRNDEIDNFVDRIEKQRRWIDPIDCYRIIDYFMDLYENPAARANIEWDMAYMYKNILKSKYELNIVEEYIKKVHEPLTGILKTCYRCGQTMPIGLFSRSKYNSDGRHTYCKDCYNQNYNRKKERTVKKEKLIKELLPQVCEWCGETFTPKTLRVTKVCSKECRIYNQNYNRKKERTVED